MKKYTISLLTLLLVITHWHAYSIFGWNIGKSKADRLLRKNIHYINAQKNVQRAQNSWTTHYFEDSVNKEKKIETIINYILQKEPLLMECDPYGYFLNLFEHRMTELTTIKQHLFEAQNLFEMTIAKSQPHHNEQMKKLQQTTQQLLDALHANYSLIMYDPAIKMAIAKIAIETIERQPLFNDPQLLFHQPISYNQTAHETMANRLYPLTNTLCHVENTQKALYKIDAFLNNISYDTNINKYDKTDTLFIYYTQAKNSVQKLLSIATNKSIEIQQNPQHQIEMQHQQEARKKEEMIRLEQEKNRLEQEKNRLEQNKIDELRRANNIAQQELYVQKNKTYELHRANNIAERDFFFNTLFW